MWKVSLSVKDKFDMSTLISKVYGKRSIYGICGCISDMTYTKQDNSCIDNNRNRRPLI